MLRWTFILRCAAQLSQLNVRMSDVNQVSHVPNVPLPLPPKSASKAKCHTLVLDIDETLIDFPAVRPGLPAFLKAVDQLFEVVVWTAGTKEYCAVVMDAIEDHCGLARGGFVRLARYHTMQQLQWMKYLPLLGRDMSSVVMLDDNERSFPLTPRNGIKVPGFVAQHEGASSDAHLEELMPLLRAVAAAPNAVRELDHWRPAGYEVTDYLEQNLEMYTYERKLLGAYAPTRADTPTPEQEVKRGPRRNDALIVKRMHSLAERHLEQLQQGNLSE